MIQQVESKSSTAGGRRRVHRRPKSQISNSYICGQPSCKKSYGTNAALYTHIKKKHGGVDPLGTVRPQPFKKQQSDQDSMQQHIVIICLKCKKKVCRCKSQYPIKQIDVFEDNSFSLFIRYIGLFGDDGGEKQGGVWCKIAEDSAISLSQSDIKTMINNFKEQFRQNVYLNERQVNYLVASSMVWEKSMVNQLYYGLIASVILPNRDMLLRLLGATMEMRTFVECLWRNQKAFQIVLKTFLIGGKKQE